MWARNLKILVKVMSFRIRRFRISVVETGICSIGLAIEDAGVPMACNKAAVAREL